MSKTIDERVVEMQFNNKQFETNVATSMSTLDKLKKSLDLDGAAKGFDNLSDAAKKCDMSTLSRSVETVSSKFSALETIAVGALLKIGSQIVTTGEQLVKSLSVDQITEGWSKYETKTAAVQTIMAATGQTIDEVSGSLEKLNWFTDETSYSLTDMTTNIGKFTSQGVELDTAVTAMEGISTWASLSGQGVNEASRAMYNLSQALGVGAVKLQDWKSIENANMATKEFKELAIEAAVATGDLTKSFDDAGNAIYKTSLGNEVTVSNFSSTLSDAWFSSEALLNVLSNYGSYADGVYELYNGLEDGVDKTTSEIISDLKSLQGADDQTILNAGYTEDQIELVRQLSNEVGGVGQKSFAAAQEAKTFTEAIASVKDAVSTGWMNTFEIIFGNYEEAKVLWTDLANAMWDVFAAGGEARNEMLTEALSVSGFDRFTQTLSDAGIELDAFETKLREIAYGKGISLDDIVAEYGSLEKAVQAGAISTDLLTEAVNGCADGMSALDLKNLHNSLNEVLDSVDELTGREHLVNAFWNAWEGVGSLLSTISSAFREIFPATTADQLYSFVSGLDEMTSRFKAFLTESEEGQKLLTDLKNTFKGIFSVLDIIKTAFISLWRVISPGTSTLGNLITKVLGLSGSLGEWLSNLDETIKKNDAFYKAFTTIIDYIKNAIVTVKEFAQTISDKLNLPSLDEAKESVKSFLNVLKEKIDSSGLDLLHTLFENICKRAEQVKNAIIAMKDGIVSSFEKVDSAVTASKFVQALTGIWNFVKTVASAITTMLGKAITGLIETLNNADFTGIIDFLNTLIAGGLVVGIKKFVDAGKELVSSVSGFKDGVSDILDGVRGCLEAWQTNLKAGALIKIAAAVGVLAASLLVLSTIDSEKLTISLAGVTALFTELMGSMALMGKLNLDTKSMKKTATAMIEVGAALLILSAAVKTLASLEPEQLAEGLIGVGVLLAELEVFLATAKFDTKASKTATGMILLAAAIKILASAVEDLAELSWENMAKGLVGVGALLVEVDVFLNTAKFSGKSLTTATGIVVLAAAIKVLASACKTFGDMSWEQIGKGLASVGALLLEIAAFTNLTGNAKHVVSTGLALIEIAAAMKILASAMQSFGSMSWEEIAKGLVSMGVALAEVALAVDSMPKNMVSIGTGLIAVGAALEIVANVLSKMGGMSWEEIAKGLVAMGGALVELAIGLNAMNGTLTGSAALLVASAALLVLAPALKSLGGMSWEEIGKGLITIAGAFTVFGVAGALLSSLAPTLLALSSALAIFGVGSVAIGAGLTLIGAGLTTISVGLTALATAFSTSGTVIVAGLSAIIIGIAALIPAIAEKIGEAIVAICGVIADGAPAIAEAVKAVVLSLVDVLVECVPTIADGALTLVAGILNSLVTYTPQIIDSLMEFLIEVIEGIANNMPQLIQAAMDLVGSFFEGVLNALSNIDTGSLIQGIAAIGLLTALVAALGAVASFTPAAMVGVLGVGVVITELAAVLAAVGGLAQIPGLEWLISEGGSLLQTIGTAIGGFVGGIVGAFLGGVSSSFPQIGSDLSAFMTNVQPFIEGASGISSDLLSGIANLTGAILLITAADLLEGVTSWLTGGSSLADFGNELIPFGEAMVEFSNTISGLDGNLINQAATAGQTLAEMASTLPNSGGVVGFFAGENDMDTFGKQLVVFGASMQEFSLSVRGLDTNAIQNASIAGQAMAEMASTLPNTGGAVSFFTGSNDMDTFGEQLVPFGKAIKEYGDAVSGLDADAVTNSATAGSALVELANTVPNTGGVVAFFAGDNDLETFGEQLVSFGEAMKQYSDSVSGIDSDAVANSATAGSALVELANTVPNTGGLISFFTGDNDLETFGEQLVPFGEAMKSYSDSLVGFDPDAVTASASAAQALAALQASLPNIGGVVDFFTGGNDLATFAEGLIPFGEAMKSYGEAVSELESYSGSIEASVIAGESLIELSKTLPNVGGVIEFFTGGNDLGAFSMGIVDFGKAMKSYGEAVSELENYSGSIEASVIAGESLVELSKTLPNAGGAVEFFTGGNDLGSFGTSIAEFGNSMRDYGEAVSGLENYSGAIEASTIAGQSLVELAKTLPNCGGLAQVFTGSNSLSSFGSELAPFGNDLSAYAEAISGVKPETVTASANAAQALSDLANGLPDSSIFDKWFNGGQSLSSFGKEISELGTEMSNYYAEVSGIDTAKLSSVITQVWSLVDLANGIQGVDASAVASFGNTLKNMGNVGVTEFANAFLNSDTQVISAIEGMLSRVGSAISNSGSSITTAMQNIMSALAKTVTEKGSEILSSITKVMTNICKAIQNSSNTAKSAMQTVMSALAKIVTAKNSEILSSITKVMSNMCTAIRNSSSTAKSAMQTVMKAAYDGANSYQSSFYTVGVNAGKGLVNGIKSQLSSASSAGRAIANAALNAAQAALDSHSPSREFIYLGQNMGEGLAIGAENSIVPASQATSKMINEVLAVAKKGLDTFEEWADEKNYYGELSLMDELAGYEKLQTMYAKGSEERTKIDREVYRIQNELVESTYQASLDWIETEKYYNRLSTQEELEAYERMQKRYIEGSEERIEIDKKIYELQNQLVDEAYQNSMDWIDEQLYYGKMSLAEELAAYKRVQSRYAKGTEERTKMDREVYSLEKEIYEAQQQYIEDVQSAQESANAQRIELEEEYADKVKSINDQLQSDIESAWKSYEDSVESRTKSLYNSYGLFDAVSEKEEVSGDTLMQNLQDQVEEFQDWQDVLSTLSARGLSKEMVEELQEMGPSAIAQIKALNNMSDDELDKYVSLWSIKYAQAQEQAVSEAADLRDETLSTIEQLRVDAETELSEYQTTWQTSLNQINSDCAAKLEELRKEFGENVGLIATDTETIMQEMADAAQAILTAAGWSETGQQIVSGITSGVEENKAALLGAITQMALEAVDAVEDTLDINSPSKVFRELGNFTSLGFVKGIIDYAARSYDAGCSVGESAKDGLSDAMQTITDCINGDMEFQPTIRPVLDLTDVIHNAGAVNSMFNSSKILALAGETSVAFSAVAGNNQMQINVDNDNVVEAIYGLRDDVVGLQDAIGKMQIYLDTGTLVGAMTDPIDAALGQKITYKGRRI